MQDPRFPIGKFVWKGHLTDEERNTLIDEIEQLPSRMRTAVQGLTEAQLNTPYREGGWTVRQVVHHVPDSHLNSYIRFKLALTETDPTIKPYNEAAWAQLPDTAKTPVQVSLALLESLHARWVQVLRGMSKEDFSRNFVHPEMGPVSLEKALALYAWHGAHHLAHITSLKELQGR